MTVAPYTHRVHLIPDTMDGERGWWYVTVTAADGQAYDGRGRTQIEALADLIDKLAGQVL